MSLVQVAPVSGLPQPTPGSCLFASQGRLSVTDQPLAVVEDTIFDMQLNVEEVHVPADTLLRVSPLNPKSHLVEVIPESRCIRDGKAHLRMRVRNRTPAPGPTSFVLVLALMLSSFVITTSQPISLSPSFGGAISSRVIVQEPAVLRKRSRDEDDGESESSPSEPAVLGESSSSDSSSTSSAHSSVTKRVCVSSDDQDSMMIEGAVPTTTAAIPIFHPSKMSNPVVTGVSIVNTVRAMPPAARSLVLAAMGTRFTQQELKVMAAAHHLAHASQNPAAALGNMG